MKKKVWLITYVGSANYGAALQLFATYKALEKIGCDVAIVNYENKYEVKQKSLKYLLTNVRSVSYTHLDVYKRQVVYGGFGWKSVGGEGFGG